MTLALLMLAVVLTLGAVPRDPTQAALDSTVSVAIAQPLATMEGAPLVTMPQDASNPMLPESGMLVLVGSALLGLAAIVRRTT